MEEVVCVAVTNRDSILLVEEGGIWTLPGGKLEEGESDEDCLRREIQEELPGTRLGRFSYYNAFRGISPRNKTEISVRVYHANILAGPTTPDAEVNAVAWVRDTSGYNLSDVTREIVDSLRDAGSL